MPKPFLTAPEESQAIAAAARWLRRHPNVVRVRGADPLSGTPAHRGKRSDMAEPGPRRITVVDVDDTAELHLLLDRGWHRLF